MFPISFAEMVSCHGLLEEIRLLPHRLVFGCYPSVAEANGGEIKELKEITDSYLYKDILSLDKVKKSFNLVKLLQALAHQVGSEVSYTELGNLCGLNNKTVERYISLLEQTYVIFRLSSYSRNQRNELKMGCKIYFVDNGVRNAVISDFKPIELRNDVGKLWENYLISERIKKNSYAENYANPYFWRTTQQQEVDYVEEMDGRLSAFEFKWSSAAKSKHRKAFLATYPESSFKTIHRENFEEFL
jgi:predicted AAA+ superfamily ATPase